MKKKILMLLLAVGLTLTITGCQGKQETVGKAEDAQDTSEETSEESEEKSEPEEEEDAGDTADTEAPKKKSGAVLGGSTDDLDGFEYLYAEPLMTESQQNEDNGKMESKSVTVMVPINDYNSVGRDYIYSDKLGVMMNVQLNPYFQYNQEDYLMTENLEKYLEDEFDEFYSTDYKSLELSDVEELGKGRAYATANYVYYDKWDDMYVPIYCVYYACELEKDLTVMLEIEINLAETTGKTPDLLAEIESFYEIDIDWDKEAQENKVSDFLASDEANSNSYSTGYLIFDLPEGWKEDSDFDYSMDCYAPGGDAVFAECVVALDREYTSESYDVTAFLEYPDLTKEMFLQEIGEDADNLEVEDMGETGLGRTVKITMDVNIDGINAHYAFYFAAGDYYLYTIYAMQTDDATEDAFAVADDLIRNAKLRE